jgi:hypothetical protein
VGARHKSREHCLPNLYRGRLISNSYCLVRQVVKTTVGPGSTTIVGWLNSSFHLIAIHADKVSTLLECCLRLYPGSDMTLLGKASPPGWVRNCLAGFL